VTYLDQGKSKDMKILIADDDSVARKILEQTLSKQGYDVISVADGEAAWEIIRYGETPPMAIIDWMMPKMDGPTLVKKIRQLNLQNYIFLILLTAKSDKEDIIHGIEAGADDYLTKPFNKGELIARLRAGARIINLEQTLAQKNMQLEDVNRKINLQNQRMQCDLDAAAAIQKTLLPNDLPNLKNVAFDWLYKPCDELAGDIFNVFQLDEKHLGLYILDVSGHGVSAALLSVTLSRILSPQSGSVSLLKTLNKKTNEVEIAPPSMVARELNNRFAMNIESGQYFTLIYGILNTETKEFSYISAGHPNPILVTNASTPQKLNHAALPIGFSDDEVYQEQTLKLHAGDRLYFYSDGITEAMNADDQQFGSEKLLQLFRNHRTKPLKYGLDIALKTVEDWSDHNLADDISVLALEAL